MRVGQTVALTGRTSDTTGDIQKPDVRPTSREHLRTMPTASRSECDGTRLLASAFAMSILGRYPDWSRLLWRACF